MKKMIVAGWLGSATLLASGSAMAGHVDLSVGIGVPVYAEPAPVYVAPQPAPVYVAPQPAVVAYPDGGYAYYGDDDDRYRRWRRHHERHWHHHHDDDDD
ncbi:hypothetical protein [Burkholderia sp. IMCC1007]|uniref:hypothetical protein n=1 Tax=Burkholderia sp. IMCC1007 TaxID=3004104 RepID=UPI0022B3EE4D|nr:hypothetical protein [Burkholderia sp. IMCC1007]